jgi:hypothetical protein
MRIFRTLLLSSLGLVAGCGGCDSCFGRPEALDDASFPSEPARSAAPRVVDAGPAQVEKDASADAPSDSAAATTDAAYLTAPSAIPRPRSAPMPLGGFQTCGVYDGPLCEKTCPKGNCRQECDGVRCDLSCAAGYCSQLCGAEGTCKMTCNGGHCVQVCAKAEGCTKECAGGSCE